MNKYGEFTLYYKTNITGKSLLFIFTITPYRQNTLEQFAMQQGVYAKVYVVPEV